jgi:hypothetical protein
MPYAGTHAHDSEPDAAARLAPVPLPKRKALLAPHKLEKIAELVLECLPRK